MPFSRLALGLAALLPSVALGCTSLLGDFSAAGGDAAVDMGPDSSATDAPASDAPARLDAPTESASDGGAEAGSSAITGVAVDYSSCALRGDGHVLCWGVNIYGLPGLGDAGLGALNPPTEVPGLTDAVQVSSADSLFTCALRKTGQIVCWGISSQGSLGDGQDAGFTIVLAPVAVALIGDAVQISVGEQSCAVRQNGQVACWGGALARSDDGGVSLVPVPVPGITAATQVAVGGGQACALLSGGAVSCWGANGDGQAGQPADGSYSDTVTTPTVVAGVSGVVQIVAGTDHTCARTSAGQVLCWGGNESSALGVPEGGAYSATPTAVPGLSGVVELAAAGSFNCARTGGGVVCWGDNGEGQLGQDPATTTSSATPVAVPGLTNVTALAAGASGVACAVVGQSAVWCWGSNTFGALAAGSSPAVPVQVSGLSSVNAVTAGNSFACAVRAPGTAWCWGSNRAGALGAGIADTTYSPLNVRTTPVQVTGLTSVTAIAAGQGFACAVAGGGVACWGDNSDGQLGLGTTGNTPNPSPTQVPGLSGVVDVAAGQDDVCVRTSSGAVECWGYAYSFTATPTVVGGVTATQLGVGQDFACALLASPGGVACWGANFYGQLGNGSTTPTGTTAVNVLNLSDAIGIGVGAGHACAVRATGEVVCWGGNYSGQLGIGQSDSLTHAVPAPVANLSNMVSVYAGSGGSCARRNDGSVVCWGTLQLAGNPAAYAGFEVDAPGANVTGIVAQAVAVGGAEACVIDQNRAVWCWGDDSVGELGDGNLLYSFQPKPIMGL